MNKKLLTALSAGLVGVVSCTSLMGCGGRDKSKINDFEISYFTEADDIESVDWVGLITGEESENQTYSKYLVGGTDLGIPVYNSKNDTMYLFFGDTFMANKTMEGDWRSNVCFTSKDWNLSDGLTFNGALTDPKNDQRATSIIDGIHQDGINEVTKIPTGGIEINGTMYMFYFSKFSWKNPKEDSMNYGGCVKSTDNGKTWERVYDLTWANHLEKPANKTGLNTSKLEDLINYDINNRPGGGDISLEDHVGYYFTQVAPIDGKDGYVYILGEGGYRTFGMKLGRVKKADFEKFEEYEYFVGTDDNDDPIWEKGIEGLQTCDASDSAFVIANDNCGEQSIMYNQFLKKWVVTYLNSTGIVLRTADNIWGPYSEAQTVLGYTSVSSVCPTKYQLTSIYGGFTHEEWVEGNGRVMYMTFSQYQPLYNSSLLRVQFYEDMAG